MYYVYVLQSKRDKHLYTGYSEDLRKRLKEHNDGKNASTKHRVPFELIYYEAYTHKLDALGRETFLKSGSGKQYIRKQLHHYFEDQT
jgi:putative endonuclease